MEKSGAKHGSGSGGITEKKDMNQANIKKLAAKPDKTLSVWLDLVRAQIQTAHFECLGAAKIELLQAREREIIAARFIKNFGTN